MQCRVLQRQQQHPRRWASPVAVPISAPLGMQHSPHQVQQGAQFVVQGLHWCLLLLMLLCCLLEWLLLLLLLLRIRRGRRRLAYFWFKKLDCIRLESKLQRCMWSCKSVGTLHRSACIIHDICSRHQHLFALMCPLKKIAFEFRLRSG